MKKCRFLKKGDLILLLCVAAGAVLLLLAYRLFFPAVTDGTVEITVSGKLYGTYPLSGDCTLTIPAADGGYNTVRFENGAVCVQDADCPDHLCVRQGTISRLGESVVCLPHGLVITVKKGTAADVDFISR